MPSIRSFMTCEPPSKLPAQPRRANFHRSGPRRLRKSVTILWLPGGRNSVKSRMASRSAVRLPIQLEARPTARSSVGKKARKTLKAMAWEIMLQRGKTRLKVPQIRVERRRWIAIAGHYSRKGKNKISLMAIKFGGDWPIEQLHA